MNQVFPHPIKVAMIGIGKMGRNHLRILNDDERFTLVAVVDPIATQAPFPLREKPVFCAQIQDLAAIDFTVAVVATPTETHFEIVSWLLSQKKHVLVEKPIASTYEQALHLHTLASNHDLKVAVGNIERGNPALSQLVEVVGAGFLGEPIHVNAVRGGRYPDAVAHGNNVVLDLAVHELDAFSLLLGPLTVTSSVCHATVKPHIYDMAQIDVRSQRGATGTMEVNWLNPQRIRNLRLTCAHGVGVVDYMDQSCTLFGLDLQKRMPSSWKNYTLTSEAGGFQKVVFQIPKQEPLKVQWERFYQFLQGQSLTPLCIGRAMAESVKIAHDALLANRGGFDADTFHSLQTSERSARSE